MVNKDRISSSNSSSRWEAMGMEAMRHGLIIADAVGEGGKDTMKKCL